MRIEKLFDIKGRKALVTGAGRGIGKVLARTLAEVGCDVALFGLHEQNLEEVAVKIRKMRRCCITIEGDVSRNQDVKKAFDRVVNEFGRLDICVNNAGISMQKPVEEMPEKDWDLIMDINMKGVFLCSQAAAHIMIPQKSGSIINIGSISARVVNVPQKQAIYNTSKAGVVMLTQAMAVEWAPHGIRVNSISPGYIKTEMTLSSMSGLFPAWESLTPLGRLGEPEELRGALIYLASDASSYTTGHDLVVDGGYTIR
ncbi:MAG: SDR family oxidoreductase [Dehalococcoidales bacterium]|nr:SDR family oxidoreductase [Dehalococcoidales bacterium]